MKGQRCGNGAGHCKHRIQSTWNIYSATQRTNTTPPLSSRKGKALEDADAKYKRRMWTNVEEAKMTTGDAHCITPTSLGFDEKSDKAYFTRCLTSVSKSCWMNSIRKVASSLRKNNAWFCNPTNGTTLPYMCNEFDLVIFEFVACLSIPHFFPRDHTSYFQVLEASFPSLRFSYDSCSQDSIANDV